MAQTRPQRKCLFLPAAGSFHDVVWRPAADIYRTRTGWLAKFDLAGIDPQEIHVGVEGRCLCVHGVRRDLEIHYAVPEHVLEAIGAGADGPAAVRSGAIASPPLRHSVSSFAT